MLPTNSDLYHLGDDYAVPAGTDLFAIGNATVIDTEAGHVRGGPGSGFGNYVILEHTMPNGETFYSLYAHLNEVLLSEGQTVSFGESGNSGYTLGANGNHLHWEISSVNKFTQTGAYGGGYDAPYQAFGGDLENGEITVNPSAFVEKYSTIGAVQRDFAPKGPVRAEADIPDRAKGNFAEPGEELLLDFDDMFVFDPEGVDSQGRFLREIDSYGSLTMHGLYAMHTPSYPNQDSGYVNGTMSGDFIAYNGDAGAGFIFSDEPFDLVEGTFTAAWQNGLTLVVTASISAPTVSIAGVPKSGWI